MPQFGSDGNILTVPLDIEDRATFTWRTDPDASIPNNIHEVVSAPSIKDVRSEGGVWRVYVASVDVGEGVKANCGRSHKV